MMSEDWEGRYYSFNKAWNKKSKERMASMRNGSGDDWFIVFSPAGVFVKAFWHEYPHEDVDAIYAGIPKGLAGQRKDAAFSADEVTFGGYHDGKTWTLRGNAKPMTEELDMLTGDPAAYAAFAGGYYEAKVSKAAIAKVLAGTKLHAKLVASISTERTLAELKADLAEIGY